MGVTWCPEFLLKHIFFSLQVCDSSFNLRKMLTEHMRQVHISLFSIECDKCPYKTWKGSHLARHKIKFHSQQPAPSNGFKPTECCGYIFLYASRLESHKANCKQIRPIRSWCKMCGKYFQGPLNQHRTDAHNVVNGKWSCKVSEINAYPGSVWLFFFLFFLFGASVFILCIHFISSFVVKSMLHRELWQFTLMQFTSSLLCLNVVSVHILLQERVRYPNTSKTVTQNNFIPLNVRHVATYSNRSPL